MSKPPGKSPAPKAAVPKTAAPKAAPKATPKAKVAPKAPSPPSAVVPKKPSWANPDLEKDSSEDIDSAASDSAAESETESTKLASTASTKEPAHNFNKEQIAVFTAAFERFAHGKEVITSKELGLVLKSLGMKLTETVLLDLINEVDTDGNGKIDKDEFFAMMDRKMKEVELIKKEAEGFMKEAFHIFDKDGDGFITKGELHLTMTNLGEKISKEEVQDMMRLVDTNNSGKISYKEFKAFLAKFKEYK